MGDVQKTVVVVLVVVHVGEELNVVDPDVGGELKTDSITGAGENLGDLDVADDDVALLVDSESDSDQSW